MHLNGNTVPVSADNLKYYVEAVHDAHEKYYSIGLMARCGIEIGYYEGCEKEIENFKKIYSGWPLEGKVSYAELNGFACVIMPFFVPIPHENTNNKKNEISPNTCEV